MDSITLSNRHPKSLVIYPEALCTKAWTQMNLMANFNEDIFTALGHGGFSDRSSFAHSSGYESAAEISRMDLNYAIKSFVKLYCWQWKWDSAGTCNYIHTSFCLVTFQCPVCVFSFVCQFSFVCLVWVTGVISLVLPYIFSVARPHWPQTHTLAFKAPDLDIWPMVRCFPSSYEIVFLQLTDRWKECVGYWLKQRTRSYHLAAESFKRPHYLGLLRK